MISYDLISFIRLSKLYESPTFWLLTYRLTFSLSRGVLAPKNNHYAWSLAHCFYSPQIALHCTMSMRIGAVQK